GRVSAGAPAPRHRGPVRDPRRRPAAGARRLPRRQHSGDVVRRGSARAGRLPHLRGAQRGGGRSVSRAPVAAFVALVIATVGAFFVTQHLKMTTPLIQGREAPAPRSINPVSEVVPEVLFERKSAHAVFIRAHPPQRHYFRWAGRLADGSIAPAGVYY